MSDQLKNETEPRTLRAGVLWGLAAGALIWALFFLQATTVDLYSWETTVVPALTLIALAAGALAVARPALRRFGAGLALGALAVLPLALAAILVLFSVLNLE
ncbi:hypothetical protein [Nocardioides jishulii]|uniref:Uncharacterized protein n=1 Tax=Nocardioides jishulii TaxID=2575440 RepID=A0A4U2YMK6_9ACTN|nr:hypothetical protein [Nocardioides jishulii]QCX27365.1 hypothetical protein FCL41_07395 [Nocardioides jishulii]TKI62170.1 hypothetical protein FC770_07060 [Nocardioides jishulii]